MKWSVPRMWEGQTVAILASGLSMSQAVADKVHAAGIHTIVLNTTFVLAPWADMLWATDARWWRHYPEALAFAGLKCILNVDGEFEQVLSLEDSGGEGFDPDPSRIRTGGNSGYAALHVAVHAGAKRVLLCGYDMYGTHWHGRHPEPLRNHGEGIYTDWLERFSTLVEPLKDLGVEVINCTPESALTCWPYMPLEKALETFCAGEMHAEADV